MRQCRDCGYLLAILILYIDRSHIRRAASHLLRLLLPFWDTTG